MQPPDFKDILTQAIDWGLVYDNGLITYKYSTNVIGFFGHDVTWSELRRFVERNSEEPTLDEYRRVSNTITIILRVQ